MTFMTYDGVTNFALIEQPVVNEAIAVLQEASRQAHNIAEVWRSTAAETEFPNLVPHYRDFHIGEQRKSARASAAARKLAGVE